MRFFLFYTFNYLFTLAIHAQIFKNTVKINADTLKEKRISLDEAWKYSSGDSLVMVESRL